ncbi:MAG: VCBS repeat-containing protein [bacterium]|nr:VCBS repeat-containing protein [bacterium]
MKKNCVFKLIVIITFICVILTSCHKKQDKNWYYCRYDNRNTCFYPFPSKPNDLNFKAVFSAPGFFRGFDFSLKTCTHKKKNYIFFLEQYSMKSINSDFEISEIFEGQNIYVNKDLKQLYITMIRKNIYSTSYSQTRSKLIETRYEIKDLEYINFQEKKFLLYSQWNELDEFSSSNERLLTLADYETGKEFWSFDMAIWPFIHSVRDFLYNDGVPEILVGGYAPANGLQVNGLVDIGESYLMLFDLYGNLIWKVTFDGFFLTTYGLVTNDNKIIGIASQSYFHDYSEFVLIDPGTGKILKRKRNPIGILRHPILADFTGDASEELVVATVNGDVIMLDSNFNVIKTKKIYPDRTEDLFYPIYPKVANDINGDGKVELILTKYKRVVLPRDYKHDKSKNLDFEILILNNSLEIIKTIPVDEEKSLSLIVYDFDNDGFNEIITVGNQLNIWKVQ